jgi:hypothetical protein
VIGCCFKAVTFSNGCGATSDNLQMLAAILKQSLRKGSRLSYLATYEGMNTLFTRVLGSSRQEVDAVVVEKDTAVSKEGMELVKGIAALWLPLSANQAGQMVPQSDKSDTEAVRLARARALLAYASCGVQDAEERKQASLAMKLWLDSERSGPIRDILHETHASLVGAG